MLLQKYIGLMSIGTLCALVGVPMSVPDDHCPSNGHFRQYETVEAYEVRPGILMMPRYSADGEVCEIGLQRRIYSPELVRLDPEMERKEIDEIANELAPADERGPRSSGLLGMGPISLTGFTRDQLEDYQNVSIDIFDKVISRSKRRTEVEGNLAAVIRWKHRRCQ